MIEMIVINITTDIINCFNSCVKTGNYTPFQQKFADPFGKINTRLPYLDLGAHYPFKKLVRDFEKSINDVFKEQKNGEPYNERSDKTNECLNKMRKAISEKDWSSFYTSYRYEMDFVIGRARDQKRFDLRIQLNQDYFESFKSRDTFTARRADPMVSRNSGEMLCMNRPATKASTVTVPTGSSQEMLNLNTNNTVMGAGYSSNQNSLPSASSISRPISQSSRKLEHLPSNNHAQGTREESDHVAKINSMIGNKSRPAIISSKVTYSGSPCVQVPNAKQDGHEKFTLSKDVTCCRNSQRMTCCPSSCSTCCSQSPSKQSSSANAQLSADSLPKIDLSPKNEQPVDHSSSVIPVILPSEAFETTGRYESSMGQRVSKRTPSQPQVSSSQQLLDQSGIFKNTTSNKEMVYPVDGQYEEGLRGYETEINSTKRKAEEELRRFENVHDKLNANFENAKRRSECHVETDGNLTENEEDANFREKLREQSEKFEEEQRLKREERQQRQKEHEEYIRKLLKESKQRLRFLMACVLQKQRFEEQQQQWAEWIEGCRRNINNLKSKFYYFESEFRMLMRQRTDSDQFLREEVKLICGKVVCTYNVLNDEFDQLKRVEQHCPDALFILVLQKCIAGVGDELLELIGLTEQLGSDLNLFDSVQKKFDSLNCNNIFSTAKLMSVCRTADPEDYKNTEFPVLQSSTVVEEVIE